MNLAPIVLFVYNRPEHTLKTLEALSKNRLARKSDLFVFADGYKKNSTVNTLNNIKKTREIVKSYSWCKTVSLIERENNLGLASSVIKGISEILQKYDRVIVLEDDIVVNTNFLEFMNQALDLYEAEKKVYGISGYAFNSYKPIKEDTYFLPIMSSWGYATWNNRWEKINFNGEELLKQVDSKKIGTELNFAQFEYYQMLKDQVKGDNDSWAIRFYVSMFLNNGVFLYPKSSLLVNIGFDGSGVHCGRDDSKKSVMRDIKDNRINVEKLTVDVKSSILKKFTSPKNTIRVSAISKIKKGIRNILPPELIALIRRKFKTTAKEEYDYLKNFPRYQKTQIKFRGRTIDIPDSASFLFMNNEIFNNHIYKFSSDTVIPYIIDGGANIGLATLYLKELFPKADIVAFEPDPQIHEILKANIASFGFNDVRIENKGLWYKSDVLDFSSEGADAGFISTVDKSSESSNSVNVVSLKDYLYKKVDFLKLDIEGSETIVLRDIKDNLNKVERIFIEYHSFVNQPQTLNEIINILTIAGFRLHINTPGLSTKVPFIELETYNNMDMQLNIYGFKEKIS